MNGAPRHLLRIASGLLLASVLATFTACSAMGESKVHPPEPWHTEAKQSELWGLPELSYEVFQRVKIGESSVGDESVHHQGKKCYIVWIGKKSYHACFLITDGKIQGKSLREVKLHY